MIKQENSKMKKENRLYEDDDGRVICSMDVEGMRTRTDQASRQKTFPSGSSPTAEPLTRSQARHFITHALLAVIVLGTVFSVIWIVFTLFLTKVLFR